MEFCWDARIPVARSTTSQTESTTEKQPARLSQSLEDSICFLEKFGVIVCKQHATAVQNLDVHLQKHHAVGRETRKAIVERYQNKQIKSPQDVELPGPLGPPIQELGEPLNGFRCEEEDCGDITINFNVLKVHLKKIHQQPWKGDTNLLYEKVKVQTFFRTGGQQRYFIVNAGENSSSLVASPVVVDAVKQRITRWRATQQQHEEASQVLEAEIAKTDRTGWFNRTKWPEHFAKRNLVHLAYQIRLPDRGESKLKLAAELVEQLIERSVKGLSTLARESRRWLKSAQRKEPDVRPLARLQNPESQARYTSYMVKFICYLLRIIADEEKQIQASYSTDNDSNSDNNSVVSDNSSNFASEPDQGSDSEDNSYSRRRRSKKQETDAMKDARELFCWHAEQKVLAIRLWDWLDKDPEEHRDAQLDALLDVFASFIFHQSGDQPFSSGLVHFTAVMGIDAEMGRLRTAKNYTYMLAGVVYCIRVLAVERLLPPARRTENSNEDRKRFLKMRKQYLADGGYSPMSEILSLLAYGKFVALAAGNSGNAYWSEDKTIFYLTGRPIFISRFRSMAQGVVAETERMLWQELLWVAKKSDRFTITLKRLADDVTFTRRGASFVNNAENKLSGGLEWMLTQAEQSEEGRRLQLRDRQWNVKQVKQYLRRVNRFLEMLLLCVHMTSGQPGRGSEVTTMRHRNGTLQDRNIFIMDGQVMTVVRYHKSQSQWDKPKIVPRFLPPRLGQVMVLYLTYLQPFQEYLTVEVLGGHFNDYVWADEQGPWGTDRLTRVLKRETGKRLGVALHTLDYRHTAVGIGRVVVGETFSRGYQDEVGEVEEAEVDEGDEDIVELQNSRSTTMGVGNYSVPIDIVKHLSVRSIEAFRPLSTLWHRFLGLEGDKVDQGVWPDSSSTTTKRRERSDEQGGQDERVAIRPRDRQANDSREHAIRKAMQQVLGQEEVGFRSVHQEQAMHAVLNKETPLVVVLPTGGGKSLLFTVPACIETGVTVVVVPYRALITDLVGRIQGCRIDCMEWKHGESNPASVVVVSADVVGDITSNGNFMGYAQMLASKGLLRRVVIDECHLIYTADSWREKMAKLKNLRLLSCPIVLLTATLPPTREVELHERMSMRCASYIRASTVRPNTRYFVSWCERGKLDMTKLIMCRRQQRLLMRRGEKGVVYCRSKKECDDLAEALGCLSYHAEVLDRAERLAEWLKEGGLIVATSALGTGVDYPGIVYILHIGMPWSMTDYAQESGRGGRGGERVDSVVLAEHGEVERTMGQQSVDLDVQAMGMFLIGSGCRRGLMSSYLDGKQVNCNDIESAGCDRCGEGLSEWLDEQEQESWEWQAVQEKMDELRHGCAVCWVLGQGIKEQAGKWTEHRTMQCSEYTGLSGRELDAFRRKIWDKGGTHSCRRCWVSQKYCATREDSANACQWPNVIIPIVYAAIGFGDGVEVIGKCGYKGQDTDEYAKWLGLRHKERVWGEYFSNAMVTAIKLVLHFIKIEEK